MKRSAPAFAGACGLAGLAAVWQPPALASESAVTLPPPRLTYVSAFAGMAGHADAAPIDWRRSNTLVGELKGHAGHLRGSAAAAPSATPTPPSAGPGVHGAPSSPGRAP